MAARLVVAIVVELLIFGLLLFVPAGTLAWWRAWVLLGLFLVAALVMSFALLRISPGLVAERMKPPYQPGQGTADKIATTLLLVAFAAYLLAIPLDVFRWHVFARPNLVASSLGMVLVVASLWISYATLRENAFAATVVRIQAERSQHVIDSGPYRVVRHPLYSGAIVFAAGMALWLESWLGVATSALVVGTLVARLLVEEAVLRRDLPGYTAYTSRVRYRLVPGMW